MINTLRDLSKNTMIAAIPNIINWNNEQVRKEFDNIYNSENDMLIKSVYVPKGVVTAHTGNFVNLRVHTLTIEDPTSLESLIIRIKHNDTRLRLSSDFGIEGYQFDPNKDFAHDMWMIKDLVPELNEIRKQLRELWIRVSPKTQPMDEKVKEVLDSSDGLITIEPGDIDYIKGKSEYPDIPDPDEPGGYNPGGMVTCCDVLEGRLQWTDIVDPYVVNANTIYGLLSDNAKPTTYIRNYIKSPLYTDYVNKEKPSANINNTGDVSYAAAVYPMQSNGDIVVNEDYINALDSEMQYYVYNEDVYTMVPEDIYANHILKVPSDMLDISNALRCKYILANSSYIKIDNVLPVSIYAAKRGQVVNILFDKEKDNDSDFVIVLKKGDVLREYEFLKIDSRMMHTKFLTLICTDIDIEKGTEWTVLNKA